MNSTTATTYEYCTYHCDTYIPRFISTSHRACVEWIAAQKYAHMYDIARRKIGGKKWSRHWQER
jgi:hypothetical protein